MAAMALGIIAQCLDLCVAYAKDRVQFGQPIGEFQLIQDKLARMEVARLNVAEPGVPGHRGVGRRAGVHAGRGVGHEALLGPGRDRGGARGGAAVRRQRLHGEFQVEQLARDAKVLQIYAGTDEIQITHIAKDLLRR